MADQNISKLKAALVDLEGVKEVTAKNSKAVVEMIRGVSEIIVYGDQKKGQYFEVFCENNVLSHFERFLNSKLDEVHIQILHHIDPALYLGLHISVDYILSHKIMNAAISYAYNFEHEEVVDYYISFMKSLAVRLDSETIKFFFNEKFNRFPLYSQAIGFFNYPERMVRTAVFTITLKVYKLKSPSMVRLLKSMPSIMYFGRLACYIRDLWLMLDNRASGKKTQDFDAVNNLIDESANMLLYVEDIMNSIPEIASIVANALLYYAIFPLVISSLCSTKKIPLISINTAFFLVRQACSIITYKPMLESLVAVMFLPFARPEWQRLVEDYPANIPLYTRQWASPLTFAFVNPQEYITYNFNQDMECFWDNSAPYLEDDYLVFTSKKDALKRNEEEKGAEKLAALNEEYQLKMLELLGKDRTETEAEHQRLARAFGVPVGCCAKGPDTRPAISIGEDAIALINSGKLAEPSEMMVASSYPAGLLVLLTSKDDTLVLQAAGFLGLVFSLPISPIIKQHCGLLLHSTSPYTTSEVIPHLLAVCLHAHLYSQLLSVSPTLRFITIDIVLSALAAAVEQCKAKLPAKYAAQYMDGYRSALQAVKTLCKTEEIAGQLYDMFKEQWIFVQQHKALRAKRQTQVLNDGALLFGIYNDPKIRVSESLRFQTEEKDLARLSIRVFLLLRQMVAVLNETENVEDVDTFPFKDEEMEAPKSDKFVITDGYRMIECQQFDSQMLKNRYIVEDEKYFILLEPDYEHMSLANVLLHTKITNVKSKIDASDPRRLVLSILKGKSQGKEEFEERILYFDDHTLALYVKNRIEESNKTALQRQIAMIATFLDSCELHH